MADAAGAVMLSWIDGAGEDTYRVEATTSLSGGWGAIGTTGANATTFTDTSSSSPFRSYRIVALANTGPESESTPSNPIASPAQTDDPVPVEYRSTPVPRLVWAAGASNTTGYRVSIRTDPQPGSGGRATWTLLDQLPASATQYDLGQHSPVQGGAAREYKVERRVTNGGPGQEFAGYILAGGEVPATHSRGLVLLVIDETVLPATGPSLRTDIDQHKRNLIGDGWSVQEVTVPRVDVPRTDPSAIDADRIREHFAVYAAAVQQTKAQIRYVYDQNPTALKAVTLIGHVPVPYAGASAPDGHDIFSAPSHLGAWPADMYYGIMDSQSVWLDSVLSVEAFWAENHNYPQDGKFDQSARDGDVTVDVPIGRIDMYNVLNRGLPDSATAVEINLLKNHFARNQQYRTGQWQVTRQAAIDMGATASQGAPEPERLAALVGAANVKPAQYAGSHVDLQTQSWLWGHASGSGNGFQPNRLPDPLEYIQAPSGKVGEYLYDYAHLGPHKVVFNMLFGSYVGDWDKQASVLRSSIAEPDGFGLASMWGGRPQWITHRMAMGETIGDAMVTTSNNHFNLGQPTQPYYTLNYATQLGGMNTSLLGDPTLRQDVVPPVTNLAAQPWSSGPQWLLTWSAPPAGSGVSGYYVYSSPSPDGPFALVSPTPTTQTSYLTTPLSSADTHYFMVRSTRLEATPSGTYHNLGNGPVVEAGGGGSSSRAAPPPPPPGGGEEVGEDDDDESAGDLVDDVG